VPSVVPTSTLPNAPKPTISTGTLPSPPGAPSTSAVTTPAPQNPNALASWPAGKSGYTLVLESVSIAAGRATAADHARRAKQRGLKDVGVLVSSQYSSLHPGYYVVFSGIYGSQAEASAALAAAHARGYPGGYPTRVTR
jgi:septal ring-binding cell division protein DamX